MLLAATVIFALYIFFIVLLYIGSLRHSTPSGTSAPEKFVSIIVPVRNEAKNINNLLRSLTSQKYSKFEIILVDDHSDDKTIESIHQFNSTLVKCFSNPGAGKKMAISFGVECATGEIIATTDADCEHSPEWLSSINRTFESDKDQFVFGAAVIRSNGSLFSRMQQLEYVSLMGTAASTLAWGFPTMCTAANMSYRKSIFKEVGGYDGNLSIASGDDEFLLRKIKNYRPGSIKFMPGFESLTITQSEKSASTFLQQRLRWAGKWRSNSSIATIFIALFIIAVQCATIGCYLMFAETAEPAWLSLPSARLLAEFFLLKRFSALFAVRWSWPAFLLTFLIYPFYVLIVGVACNFIPYTWKGRKFNSG
jgi:poly-beta-1,6-N-acetyl-D-glucosamine synthase